MLTITKGENAVIRRNLLQANGSTALNVGSLYSIIARLKTKSTTYLELTYPHANLRIGQNAAQIEFEIVESISDTLPTQALILEFEMKMVDPDFGTDIHQINIHQEIISIQLAATDSSSVDTATIIAQLSTQPWRFDSTILDFSSTLITFDAG